MPDENDILFDTYSVDLIGLIKSLVTAVVDWILNFLSSGVLSFWWSVFSLIAVVLSVLFFLGFVYARIRYIQLAELQEEELKQEEEAWARTHGAKEEKPSRLSEVRAHIASENPNDWRLAIIEADIILGEMLTNAGYVGDSIGEQLKGANTASFRTVQDAWDAHRVRNEIAHAGSDFVLTQRLAQETITKYEHVFAEFGVS